MPSDYEEIREDNIRRRGAEFDDIGRLISEQLYSDRSHFVYELLQNAEDALERRFKHNPNDNSSREVQFRLFEDKLEFRHFGIPFNEEDVKGVSDVLKGTKTEDFVQIGKFGIGFKSVYAFTASPEIHSGDEHFVIKRYIRPEQKLPKRGLEIEPRESVFIFPFDHADLSPNRAFELISNKLQELGPRVLLFLKWIEEIKWCVDLDKERGQYLKETKPIETVGNGRRVTVIGEKSEQDEDESWLIFERPVKVPDKSDQVSVEVGFRLETSDKDKKEGIVRENNSRLVVYFPTEKDTRLGFLIQGPYRTTPARDNIPKDNAWNKQLIKETAELVVEALRQLKKMGLLSVSLLEALPIRFEDDWDYHEDREATLRKFYEEFYPIFNKVRKAFMEEALLPTNDVTFVAAPNAKLVRGAALMKILNQEQLNALFQSNDEIKWLPDNITRERTHDLHSYLTKELEVEEVDPEAFARHLSEQFLARQDDEWFITFYAFLSDQKALWRPPRWQYDTTSGILRNKPILRLQNNTQVNPFQPDGSPSAYLAVGTDSETSLPIVKVILSSHPEARQFLSQLGIEELDLVAEVIEQILPKYTDDSVTVESEENKRDLKKIEHAYKTDSQEKQGRLQDSLLKTPFILADRPNEKGTTYRRPDEVYFGSDELYVYFSGNDSFTYVSLAHPQESLLKELGVENAVRVYRRKKDGQGYVCIEDDYGLHERGHEGFDPDIHVDGLRCAVSTPSLEKSAFIWNKIAIPHSDCIRGVVEKSTRQTYEGSEKEERISSKFGRLLIDAAWLPDSDGHMHKPTELTLDDLPESFVHNERLAQKLGMQKNAVKKLAEEVGVDPEDIEAIKQNPEEFKQWKETVAKKANPVFPTKSVNDPGRREKKISKQHDDALQKQYEIRDRSIRSTRGTIEPKTWLREQYMNDSDQMICQICEKEMPFKKRNGEYYFEAVEALSRDHFPKEHEAQFLALCPLCAAMYDEFIKQDDNAMEKFKEELVGSKDKSADELTLPLRLGEHDMSIRFVETHWKDMKTILRKYD